ncbi:uncharacterized protein LOC132740366 [Ruditapes philippinarum]|uniref:uncharacterized protein LOC132740366 n=1 Tax=Ruditapes philippinarum TaxID=129788 RepID=UPI00295BDE62|nr:uncharacterized protein LOC132740366 [Ruditapes philippinarum]
MESAIQKIKTVHRHFETDSVLQQNEVTSIKEGILNLEDKEDGEIIEEPDTVRQVIIRNDRVDEADETKCTVMNINYNDVNVMSKEIKNECRENNECVKENAIESVVEKDVYQVKLLKWPGVPYFHHEQSVFDIEKLKKAQSQRSSKLGATCSKSNKRKRLNDKTDKMEPLGKKMRKDKNVSFKIQTKQEHYKNKTNPLEAFDASAFDKPSVITKTNNRDIGVTDKHVTKTFSNPWDNIHEVSVKGRTPASERNLVEYDDFELYDDTETTLSSALKQEYKSQKEVNLRIGLSGKVIDDAILSKDLNCNTFGARVVCSQEPMTGQGIKHTRVSRKLSECDPILQDDNCTESEYTDTEIIPSRTQATIKEPNDPCDLRNVLNKKRRQQPGLKTDKTCDKGYIKTYNLRTRRKTKPLTSVSRKHMIRCRDKDKLKLSGISSRKRVRKVGSSKETDGDLKIEIKGDVYQVLDEV